MVILTGLSGRLTSKYVFSFNFSFSAEKGWPFSFRPKKEIDISVAFIFRPKMGNSFSVGL